MSAGWKKDQRGWEGTGVHHDKSHTECKIRGNCVEEQIKTKDRQAPEGKNRFLQPCSAFPGTLIYTLSQKTPWWYLFPALSPAASNRTSAPACSLLCQGCQWAPLLALSLLTMLTQALRDGAHQGGHGWPWGSPGAWLPDAKDRLALAAPQQGYWNLPVHGG